MSDLISRQAAIDALNEVSEHYTNKGREWHPHINFMVDAIRDLPSAQPSTQLIAEIKVSKEDMEELLAEKVEAIKAELVQPKTGKWIKCGYWSDGVGMGETYGSCYKCSECGIEVQSGEDRCGMNFCYNCGAKMEGET